MAITTTATNPLDTLSKSTATGSSTASSTGKAGDTSATDRFLKLLITQMQNQDPLNPMDNAQVTSQMAQISTVSGIQDLNTTVSGLNGQFTQLQALQGASLVGHAVTLEGNRLDVTAGSGVGVGGFELTSPADKVMVEISDSTGRVVETVNMGAQPKGLNGFSWTGAKDNMSYSFKVAATASGTPLAATPLMRDHVQAVSLVNNTLTLQTASSGPIEYSKVRAVN